MRAKLLPLALTVMGLALLFLPWIAEASDPFLVVPAAEVVDNAPAYRYANMEARLALQELDRRGILYQRVEPHGQVRTPIRLTGRLQGVHIHSSLPEHERPTTPFEICDARLALALDDFAAQLARRDIVELIHFTMYRPAVGSVVQTRRDSEEAVLALGPLDGWSSGRSFGAKTTKAAKKNPSGATRGATRGTTRTQKSGKKKVSNQAQAAPERPERLNTSPSRHPLGLAIDPGVFIKRDGTILSVASHFKGKIGAQTCGRGASRPTDPRAEELWSIVCDAFDAKIFTYTLTPNFDQPHQDHFHMEINPGVRWFLYH